MKKVILLVILLSLMALPELFAQCAMCRTTVEKAVLDGQSRNFGAGLNAGILYLFVMPYLLFAVLAVLWYRHSKKYTEQRRKLYQALLSLTKK